MAYSVNDRLERVERHLNPLKPRPYIIAVVFIEKPGILHFWIKGKSYQAPEKGARRHIAAIWNATRKKKAKKIKPKEVTLIITQLHESKTIERSQGTPDSLSSLPLPA